MLLGSVAGPSSSLDKPLEHASKAAKIGYMPGAHAILGSNPSGPTNLNSAVFCQNDPTLRVFGLSGDELRKDAKSKGLLNPRAGG